MPEKIAEAFSRNSRLTLGIKDISLANHLACTKQSKLPQAPALEDALYGLSNENLLEEAYLRGSFSFGLADPLSDIDLFAVVDQGNLPEAHQKFQRIVAEKNDVIIGCHDKFVADYGGIGFTYLCHNKQTKNLFQFDMYFVMKGVPPRTLLYDAPRVYSKDSSYCWLEEDTASASPTNQELPEKTKDYLASYTKAGSDSEGVVLRYSDLVVGLFMMDKHLKRQQNARAFNDNFQNTNATIDILRYGLHRQNFQSPQYSFDALSNDIARSNDNDAQGFALEIREQMDSPASSDKIKKFFALGTHMTQVYAPNYYEQNKEKLAILDKRIFKSNFIS